MEESKPNEESNLQLEDENVVELSDSQYLQMKQAINLKNKVLALNAAKK